MAKKRDPKQAIINKQAQTIASLRKKIDECVEVIDEQAARILTLLEKKE